MEVVVGTYEELILGYKLIKHKNGYSLEQSFTDHSHVGCVKAVAVSPRGVLASGSSDEMVRLFNLQTRQEMGALAHHEGTITCIDFHGRHHMLTSSEDGRLAVWKVGRWECLRTLKGHKDQVLHFAIHPSGKMALSVSRDHTLKTWNLMTGKCAYTTNIKYTADLVLWSPDGDQYVIITGDSISVYKVETAKVHQTIKCSSRISCAVFLQNSVLAVGGEGGDVHLFDLEDNKHITEFSTETNRVKSMCRCLDAEDTEWLVTASSDGHIQLWKLTEKEGDWKAKRELSHDTNFRPTCVAVYVRRKEHSQEQPDESVTGEVEESIEQEDTATKPHKTPSIGKEMSKQKAQKRKVVVETESSSPRKKMKKKQKAESKSKKLQKNKKRQLF